MAAALRDMPEEGIELIQSFEGILDGDPSTVNIDAYLDPVGIWTIGWGHAITYKGDFLRGAANQAIARSLYPGGITRAQAETLLRGDLVDSCSAVTQMCQVELDDGPFAALVSFAFNAGTGNLSKSTLLRLLNAGDMAGAADQFLAWDKGRVNGVLQSLPGLTRRRRAERAMFLGQDWRAAGAVVGAAVAAVASRGALASVSRGAPAASRGVPAAPTLPVRPNLPNLPTAPSETTAPSMPNVSLAPAQPTSPAAPPKRARQQKTPAASRGATPKPATSRGRTTTPKAPPPAASAKPRSRQTRP